MTITQGILLGIFAVATIVGYFLINNVPSLLHTPLMSGMNALSGVTILGALIATAVAVNNNNVIVGYIFGSIAIILAMLNVAGGFFVTNRMLRMIAKPTEKSKKIDLIFNICALILSVAFIALSVFFMSDLIYYIFSGILVLGVLAGIFLMSKVKLSVIGNRLSLFAMTLGIVLVMIKNGILPVYILYIAMAAGILLGITIGYKVKMIQMPQMVALLNGFGGGASAIVGAFALLGIGAATDYFSLLTSALAIAIGAITLLGSLVAAGKLHRILPQKPILIKGHQPLLLTSLILMVIVIALSATKLLPGNYIIILLALNLVISSAFGLLFSIRVGGADMPITISLLNSLSGVAGAIAGLAIGDLLLVAVGGIVGASGLLLTQIMCKAINRSLMEILLGKTSSKGKKVEKTEVKAEAIASCEKKVVDPVAVLKSAKKVIIVPGYGMAIAQAQHSVKALATLLKDNGAEVKYAIHPVAGRMPGHMNVLLCEADVDYEELYEMKDINAEFAEADATIVIGANDVLNPAAREAEGTPIYGMPVLNVDKCKNIYLFNYDTKPGYAGVANPLYAKAEGVYLYLGNAADTLKTMIENIKSEGKVEDKQVVEAKKEKTDNVSILSNAKKVIIVPGYGMAIAQAQHLVKKLAEKLKDNGAEVKYAIHPVAGRMPGHMNVLLCEADVDYEELFEMKDINAEFASADATIVVGANDVLNPAAREAQGTPIYGMPVLNVDQCKNIFIFNYDTKPGYAGVNNPLYAKEEGVYLYLGNAADTLQKVINNLDGQDKENQTNIAEEECFDNTKILTAAKKVIIVPGYGMAIAQAQHLVKKLAEKLKDNGAEVKYAIHPVAGRMPGHMNVLLCEADVDYEELFEMKDINAEFAEADATIVVGANDVLNPAAREAQGTPIYGMPVLNVDQCKNIFIFNYDTKPGYAGVNNPLYTKEEGVYLYLGNAEDTLKEVLSKI
ncbi:NADP transhydrogenase subunit beta [bacterium]|nr:NADP transhydrogenase subunit beta [bacterium]